MRRSLTDRVRISSLRAKLAKREGAPEASLFLRARIPVSLHDGARVELAEAVRALHPDAGDPAPLVLQEAHRARAVSDLDAAASRDLEPALREPDPLVAGADDLPGHQVAIPGGVPDRQPPQESLDWRRRTAPGEPAV